MRTGLSLSHFGFFVTDIDVMEDFYASTLGFTVTDRGVSPERTIVFLSRDPDEHHQVVLATGRPENLDYNVINQISLRADSLATLKNFHRQLLTHSIVTDVQSVSHGNSLSVYARDPEGNRLELFIDLPYYTDQPCRIPFDLERDDDVILQDAERVARSLPGFCSREEWRARIEMQMGITDIR